MNIKNEFQITKPMVKERIQKLTEDLNFLLEYEDSVLSIEVAQKIVELTEYYFTISNKKES